VGHIRYRQWLGPADFRAGTMDGVVVSGNDLAIGTPAGIAAYDDAHVVGAQPNDEWASWTAPVVAPGFAFTELVASWNTRTPPGTWIDVSVVVTRDGQASKRYCLGRWAMHNDAIARSSLPGQGDDTADVVVDVLTARPGIEFDTYQVTVTLCRPVAAADTPLVSLVGVMVSALPEPPAAPGRVPAVGEARVLDVPAFSQEVHRGRYPELSGGGEAWCSPTSTAMVLAYFGAGPAPADYAWVDPTYDDPWVIHAAAHTHDALYGNGNWPFNTAYASELGMRAFVTRLRSLAELQQLIGAGIPPIVSVSFAADAMTGAGYSTQGHLMVVVGFTDDGDVIVNDPASHLIASNDEVRTVYDRDQFTAAWLAGSKGIVYVIHPPGLALPPPPAEPNW
jgi:hypothetical protein